MLLLATACGQQHDAESLVKDFMKENMRDYSGITNIDFGKIDSTRHLNDSVIDKIRKAANESPLYEKRIEYGTAEAGKKLMILRVHYKKDNREHSDTYYMDESLTHIVAFKTN